MKFLPTETQNALGLPRIAADTDEFSAAPKGEVVVRDDALQESAKNPFTFKVEDDAPPCHVCGAIMVRNGTCYKCLNCGTTSGCS